MRGAMRGVGNLHGYDGGSPPAGYIISVQQVQIAISGSDTQNTATISSVSTTRTLALFNGVVNTNTVGLTANDAYRVELTNATTVTAYRNTASGSATVYVTVVEFGSSLVDSVQQGTIALSTAQTSNTATISSVTTSRSAVYLQGQTNTDALLYSMRRVAYVRLTNSTTVTATRNQTGTTSSVVGFAVIQFASAVIQSVQETVLTSITATSAETFTLSTVVAGANTLNLYGGVTSANANWVNSWAGLGLGTNPTTASGTLTRSGVSIASRTTVVTTVEFVPGILNARHFGNSTLNAIGLAGTTSATRTITAVDTAKSFVNQIGQTPIVNANPAQATGAIELTNSTTITAVKNTSTNAAEPGYEVLEFV